MASLFSLLNGERAVVLFLLTRILYSVPFTSLFFESIALSFLAVVALFAEISLENSPSLITFRTRPGASSGTLLGAVTLPALMLSKLIQLSRGLALGQVAATDFQYEKLLYWAAYMSCFSVLLFVGHFVQQLRRSNLVVKLGFASAVLSALGYIILQLGDSYSGLHLVMLVFWMLGHGVAAIKLIQHIFCSFPSCASIGEGLLVTVGLTTYAGDMLRSTLMKIMGHFISSDAVSVEYIIKRKNHNHPQDDHGDLSSVNMDTAVAIRTLEATFKSSADAAAVEAMILKLTEKEGPLLKSRGKAGKATKIAVLIWRSLLVMSREWKYYWLRLVLFMLLALCIGTVFSGLGHSLSSVVVRVAAVFVFVSFTSLLSIAGVTAHMNEIKTYACEASNKHSGPIVFLLGQLLSSIPFLFLIAISSSLVFYFLIGLRDEFSLLMYFVLNFFMCLLVNEGLLLAVAAVQLDVFWSILTLVVVQITMMLSAGYFRLRSDLPGTVWNYPLSYIALHTYSIQGLLENEYVGTNFSVGAVRAISGYQAVSSAYDISPSVNGKWNNLMALFLMALGYRLLVFILLSFCVGSGLCGSRMCRPKSMRNV